MLAFCHPCIRGPQVKQWNMSIGRIWALFIILLLLYYFYISILPLQVRVVFYFNIWTLPLPWPWNCNNYMKLYNCISFFHPSFLPVLGLVFARLSAGLLRQATYTTTRLGIYTILFEKMTSSDGRPPSFIMKVTAPRRCTWPVCPSVPTHSPCCPTGADWYDSRGHWSLRRYAGRGCSYQDDGGRTVSRSVGWMDGCRWVCFLFIFHKVSVCLQPPGRPAEGL